MVPIFPNFLGRFKGNGGCTIATPFLALGIQCDCGHVTISMDLRRILTKEKKRILNEMKKSNDPKAIAYSLFVFPLHVFGPVKYISGHVCCCIFQIHRLVHTSGNGNFRPVSFGRCYRPNPEKTWKNLAPGTITTHTNPQHPNILKWFVACAPKITNHRRAPLKCAYPWARLIGLSQTAASTYSNRLMSVKTWNNISRDAR